MSMSTNDNPVYIAGLGVISAIGRNVAENLRALESGEAGMQVIRYLETAHRADFPLAEVKASNEELAALTGVVDDKGMMPVNVSRTALLSFIAAKEALESSGLQVGAGARALWTQTQPADGGHQLGQSRSLRLGMVSANTVGGMDKTEEFYRAF